MGKKKSDVRATMELIGEIHDETLAYQQEMYEERNKAELNHQKWLVTFDELHEKKEKIDTLTESVKVLENNNRVLERNYDELRERTNREIARLQTQKDSLIVLLNRLTEPRQYLQINFRRRGQGNPIEYAQVIKSDIKQARIIVHGTVAKPFRHHDHW